MNRTALAEFLRIRRATVKPGHVGLPDNGRRRTPGLRRQEVAQLAGMSVDYYTRLEQARGPRPSRQVLAAIGRALLLTIDERHHLFHLAGETPEPAAAPDRDVPEGIRHLLESMTDVPAYVVDAKYDVLAANPLARAFLSGTVAAGCAAGNVVLAIFAGEDVAGQLADPDRAVFARSCVADLRAATARYPDDPALAALVAGLLRDSPEFAAIWSEHQVTVRRSMVKRLVHPVVGPMELGCQVLLVPERDQRLILYTARPGSADAEALRRLRTTILHIDRT